VIAAAIVATLAQVGLAMHETHRKPFLECRQIKRKGEQKERCFVNIGRAKHKLWGLTLTREQLRAMPWPYTYSDEDIPQKARRRRRDNE
jgi:hypothetical protein